jgi:hypothetical protein
MDDNDTEWRAMAKLGRLPAYLNAELPGGGDDQGVWAARAVIRSTHTTHRSTRKVRRHQIVEHRDKKRRRLARARAGTAHDIPLHDGRRNSELLDRSHLLIATTPDVAAQGRAHTVAHHIKELPKLQVRRYSWSPIPTDNALHFIIGRHVNRATKTEQRHLTQSHLLLGKLRNNSSDAVRPLNIKERVAPTINSTRGADSSIMRENAPTTTPTIVLHEIEARFVALHTSKNTRIMREPA